MLATPVPTPEAIGSLARLVARQDRRALPAMVERGLTKHTDSENIPCRPTRRGVCDER
jgi:hypothetical protein